ncbi:hypothetical protein M3P36_08865 [Altererythrobacter sp. KTW20L]|uniref:hypothetical protein n=1 Tax=Altererythrobacter sp. KTW20L TaxID=2942210 RepID=UPI0020BFF14D|nr:hypothetical protein [Altererythrobacter sp. KTW20L]MCL6251152.1 hypothetical protein [Altererythrobacter sp. KTW20L]
MKRIITIAFLAASTTGTAAYAQERDSGRGPVDQAPVQSTADEGESEEEESYLNEVVCRSEPVTGSRTRVNRTCLTRRDWSLLSEDTRRGIDHLDRDANQSVAAGAQNSPAGGF